MMPIKDYLNNVRKIAKEILREDIIKSAMECENHTNHLFIFKKPKNEKEIEDIVQNHSCNDKEILCLKNKRNT